MSTTFPSRGPRTAALLERLPTGVLRQIAKRQARTAPLGLDPGWHFGRADEDGSRAAAFRRDLHGFFRELGDETPISVDWYDGLKVGVFLGNDISHCLYVGGSYEPNEFVLLAAVLDRGAVVVDGGANDGLYSIFCARRVGTVGRVLAVEPSSRERSRLLANVHRNRLRNVEVLDVALGSERGTAELAIAEAHHAGLNTVGSQISTTTVETAGHEQIRVETLDSIVDERGLSRLDVVKLDVEGSEVAAIRGGADAIRSLQPLLLVEAEEERLASQRTTTRELLDLIASLGYDVYVFDEGDGQLRRPPDGAMVAGNVVCAPRGWKAPRL